MRCLQSLRQSVTFVNSVMKLIRTNSRPIEVYKGCQSYFGPEVPNCLIIRKADKFLLRNSCVENNFCRAMVCISAAYAVMRCLCVCVCVSVCLSVCHVRGLCQHE